jgi:cytochrome c
MKLIVLTAAAVAAIVVAFVPAIRAAAPPAGDPERGKAVYARCMYCHAIDVNRVGPMHDRLFGRRAGTVPGFNYSAAMKRAGENGLIWNAETLDRYLTEPRKMVPGTRMLFGGIADPKTRADLIAYLRTATAEPEAATAQGPSPK